MKNIKYQRGLNIDDLPELVSEVVAGIGNLNLIDATFSIDEGEYVIESDNGFLIDFKTKTKDVYFEYNGNFAKALNLRNESDVRQLLKFAKEYITLIQKLEDLTEI